MTSQCCNDDETSYRSQSVECGVIAIVHERRHCVAQTVFIMSTSVHFPLARASEGDTTVRHIGPYSSRGSGITVSYQSLRADLSGGLVCDFAFLFIRWNYD